MFFRSNISDQQAAHLHVTVQERADLIEEVLTEVSVYLGMLYHLIEVFKGHDDFADELSQWYLSVPVSNLGAELRSTPSELGPSVTRLSFQRGIDAS